MNQLMKEKRGEYAERAFEMQVNAHMVTIANRTSSDRVAGGLGCGQTCGKRGWVGPNFQAPGSEQGARGGKSMTPFAGMREERENIVDGAGCMRIIHFFLSGSRRGVLNHIR